jgi:hypothetical protein
MHLDMRDQETKAAVVKELGHTYPCELALAALWLESVPILIYQVVCDTALHRML